jgi:hypothetical protein
MDDTGPLLIQILPQLKPARCGVSDQALLLAEELNRGFGVRTAFLVLNSDERCDVPYAVIHCAPAQSLESILKLSGDQPCSILVHVSGYGYSSDGAPTLLADALSGVKDDGRIRIAAYFHELFAGGPPWTSAFWYSSRQKAAIRKIAKVSELIITNTGVHARWLERETLGGPAHSVELLPVFSAAGEWPLPAWPQRARVMAVFGLPATRKRSYEELSALPGLLQDLGVEEILDIGAGSEVPMELNGIPLRQRGKVDAEQLAEELSHVRCGFLPYDPLYLPKSSIFATYCAQGTVPVIAKSFDGEVDGLRDGVHVLSPATARRAVQTGLDRCSQEARKWYVVHSVRAHAETYARWLNQSVPALERQEVRH